jgi:hypothetical protein
MGQAMMHVVEPLPNILDDRSNLPQETQEIIAKAMAKDREERYPTAMALATAVNDLSEKSGEKPVAAVPIKKRRSRLPATFFLGVVIILLCLGLVGAGAVYVLTSGNDEEATVVPTAELSTDTPEAEVEPSQTISAPATAAIILPGRETTTEAAESQTETAPGLLPTLRATPTEITPSPTATRLFIPTAIPTDTPPPPPPPTSPPQQPPTQPPPTNIPPPTNTPVPPPPTNTPPPIHTQAANS